MYNKRFNQIRVAHWQRFSRRNYSAFCSLKYFAIGVLTVSTLSSATSANNYKVVLIQGDSQVDEYYDSGGDGPLELQEVVVETTLSSLSEGRPAKIVRVITGDEVAKAAVQSLPDVLKLVSSVDVRQRGGYGVQTDINIDGGTHDQVTILLNGVNITSPQVGHYSADWPVNFDEIERIELLEGASSRIMGGSSLMGAINIVTSNKDKAGARVAIEGGSYGTFSAAASANKPIGCTVHGLSVGTVRSDGGTVNSDFSRIQGYYHGKLTSKGVDLNWQAGASAMSHGANTFYSAAYPNQHDELQRYIMSVSATTKGKVRVEPMIFWHRLNDHYQLVRDTDFGENFHRTDVSGGRLNVSTAWVAGTTSVGSELRHEHLISSALGIPLDSTKWVSVPGHDSAFYKKEAKRTNVNLYVEHNLSYGRFYLSAGLTASMNTGIDHTFRIYPGVDAAYTPAKGWRVFASWSKAYRMPTFTDLYYKSVVLEGNKDIKPENMQSWQGGASYINGYVSFMVKGFYHRGHNMIDWVMYTPDDIYHSTGFDLDNLGFNVQMLFNLNQILGASQPLSEFTADYTHIHQKRHDDIEIFKSNYALEYLRHKVVLGLKHRIVRTLTASWSLRWIDRCGSYIVYENAASTGQLRDYSPYGVLDLKLTYNLGKWQLHINANNLTNHRYYDFGNIPQPGLWIMGGGTVSF